jgi:hypothetical protein
MEITSDSGDFQIGTNDGLSCMPIQSITENILLGINGDQTSVQLSDIAPALRTIHATQEDRAKYWSASTAMPDSYQRHSDWNTYGSARNPLAAYGENSAEPNRGGFEYEVISPTKVRVIVTEPLFISPLLMLDGAAEGMVNISQLTLQLQLKSDLGLAWSHASTGNAIGAVSVTFYQPPEVMLRYLTPDSLQKTPMLQTLPYHRPQQYVKTMPNLADGASVSNFVSDSVKLGQVPLKAIVFARRSRGTSNFTTTQSFLRLTHLQLTFDNQASLLGTASEQQLHEMSVKNGSNLTWSDWGKYRGSVAVVNFGSDIGLPDDLAPGTQGQFNAQFQASFKNVSGDPIDAEMYVVYIYEGSYEIMPNAARSTLGNLTRGVVLEAVENSDHIDATEHDMLAGGSFLSGLSHFIKKAARGIATIAKIATPVVAAVAPEFAPIAAGVGAVSDATASALGGSLAGGGVSGGALAGGRLNRRSRRVR